MGTPSNVEIGPGVLYVAPIGTTEPTSATAALPSAFREVGYTEDGTTITYDLTNEAVNVAEEFDPIAYRTTARAGTVAFQMAEATRQNLALVLNLGANLTNDGTLLEPPAPGSEVRVMFAHRTDAGALWVLRRCLQAGSIEMRNQKAPNKKLLPASFRMEKPTGAALFGVYPTAAGLV